MMPPPDASAVSASRRMCRRYASPAWRVHCWHGFSRPSHRGSEIAGDVLADDVVERLIGRQAETVRSWCHEPGWPGPHDRSDRGILDPVNERAAAWPGNPV